MKKSIPKIREREGNEKNPFPKFGNGKGMKKIHSRNSGRESEASILGNDREREFPLTPASEPRHLNHHHNNENNHSDPEGWSLGKLDNIREVAKYQSVFSSR